MTARPLKQAIPPGRSYQSVLHHFEVERAIARRLMAADRAQRKRIYCTMYDELFAEVPDHPRLTRRDDPALTARVNRSKLRLLQPFLEAAGNFLEFGSGDCRFAFEVAARVEKVYAVDIADQIGPGVGRPDNFELVVYDGYDLGLPDDSIDVAFSDQLIEHLHPEDSERHFKTVLRLLKPGGVYVLRTPHRLTGPHDVSRYFSDRPECFHLKEWSYGELAALLRRLDYRSVAAYWFARGMLVRVPVTVFSAIEAVAGRLPRPWRKGWIKYLVPSVSIAAYK
jgi:SAM-dependent methyltransferase